MKSPRHYGFHMTLKPPFHLAEPYNLEALKIAAAELAAEQTSFTIPALDICILDDFVALRPSKPCAALHTLANHCVTNFEDFRAPPSKSELQRRCAAGLTDLQTTLLQQWGYPYVFEEFRPHFSFTGRIDNAKKREIVLRELRVFYPAEVLRGVPVNSISIFYQPDTSAPFVETSRFQFGE
jgi:hypothetical protein